ncbi:hypothetical protein [Streptomyces lavendulae]|uniref:hypothetical protein n=1 Tax=Streptomyces lavendulae TaxID=1914 RepID=UPI00131CB532|nr:hypothetical protein [Streptomyces lavendulae]
MTEDRNYVQYDTRTLPGVRRWPSGATEDRNEADTFSKRGVPLVAAALQGD